MGCRHSLQRALKPWGRGSEPLRRHASCEEVEARALGTRSRYGRGDPAESTWAPLRRLLPRRAGPALRGRETASGDSVLHPFPPPRLPFPAVCGLHPLGRQSRGSI